MYTHQRILRFKEAYSVLKRTVMISFCLLLGYALWLFLKRDTRSLRTILQQNAEPRSRILMYNFNAYEFKHTELVGQVSGKQGFFVAPNLWELKGDVFWFQKKPPYSRSILCDHTIAEFHSKDLLNTLTSPELSSVVWRGHVRGRQNNRYVETEFMKFHAQTQSLVGDKPIYVREDGSDISAEQGFYFDLNSNIIELFGKTHGKILKTSF
jgi:hypothetical protein